MKKSFLLRTCAAFAMPIAAVTVLPAPAAAQQITTSIQGQVTNESGAPLANATVSVTDTRTGNTQTFTTNAGGTFSAQNLTTGGPYSVTASADGYQGQTVPDIVTNLQGATQLTFSLTAAATEAEAGTIVVTAARVRATQLEVGPGTAFTTEVMANAPSFNRDVRDVLRTDPRVSLDRDDGGSGQDRISCLGGNDRGNSFTVDGLAQSDIYGLNDTGFSSRSSTPVPYDAVRETQVQFAPMDTEYGNFTGCGINVVTKSGTNKFHGTAWYEYSDDTLRGGKVDGLSVGEIQADKRFGFSLGGPIIKDRLFFFGAYEKQTSGEAQDDGPVGAGFTNEVSGVTLDQFNQISQVLSSVYGVETGPLVHNRPFTNKRLFGRLDWQITDNHRFEATYQRLKESVMRSDDFFTGSSPQVTGANSFYLSGTNSKYYSGRLYSTWSDVVSTELRYSHADVQDIQDPVGGGEAQSDNPIPRIIVGIDNPTGTPDATILAGPGTSRSANDLKTKVDVFKAVANFDTGDHKLKVGAEINKTDIFNLFVANATGTLVFRSLADLQNGLLSPGVTFPNPTPPPTNLCTASNSTLPVNVVNGCSFGAFGNFSRTGDVNDAAAKFKRTIYSMYFQDDWRVNDRLNAVAGIRMDMFDGPGPDVNPTFIDRYGFDNTTGFSDVDPVLMPRLGFTYDLNEFSLFRRAKLTGGVGVFSGGDPLVWFANAFQNNGFAFSEGTTSSGCPAGQVSVLTNGQFTGLPDCMRQNGIDRAAQGLGDTQSVDPDIKLPTVWRANIGFQSDFEFGNSPWATGWHVNLDYIYSYYKNPFTIVDLSQTPAIFGGTVGSGAAQLPAAIGLNGFTIDGRPIYRAIDPSNAGCDAVLTAINPTPVWTNVTGECFFQTNADGTFRRASNGSLQGVGRDDELMLTNSKGYHSHIASFILSKDFDRGILSDGGSSYFSLGYAFTASQDRRNMFRSTAGSNYDATAAFDRQNPDVSRGFYGSKHNIAFSGNFREELLEDLASTLGFTFVARSGRPYSLTFTGGSVFNDQASGTENALVYIPSGPNDPNVSPSSNSAAVQKLTQFASGLDCAKKYLGRSIERNTCSNDWYFDMDLRLAQEIPGPGRLLGSPYGLNDKITLYAMFDNFLNLLNNGWNIQRRREFNGLQDVANITGVDSQGRYIISAVDQLNAGVDGLTPYQKDEFINTSSSLWRIKVGISYEF